MYKEYEYNNKLTYLSLSKNSLFDSNFFRCVFLV